MAGEHLQHLRAIYVPAEHLYEEKLTEYVGRLNLGKALVLEMKPRSGILMWNSNASEAVNYGLATPTVTTEAMPGLIQMMREQKPDIYLVAQISCCLDELYASRCTTVTLRNAYGANYLDTNGTWLDPYNQNLRDYVVEMVRELYDMGFDEVLLKDVSHPILPLADNGM